MLIQLFDISPIDGRGSCVTPVDLLQVFVNAREGHLAAQLIDMATEQIDVSPLLGQTLDLLGEGFSWTEGVDRYFHRRLSTSSLSPGTPGDDRSSEESGDRLLFEKPSHSDGTERREALSEPELSKNVPLGSQQRYRFLSTQKENNRIF